MITIPSSRARFESTSRMIGSGVRTAPAARASSAVFERWTFLRSEGFNPTCEHDSHLVGGHRVVQLVGDVLGRQVEVDVDRVAVGRPHAVVAHLVAALRIGLRDRDQVLGAQPMVGRVLLADRADDLREGVPIPAGRSEVGIGPGSGAGCRSGSDRGGRAPRSFIRKRPGSAAHRARLRPEYPCWAHSFSMAFPATP